MPAKIKRGDRVVVIAGKDRGKRGTVRADGHQARPRASSKASTW